LASPQSLEVVAVVVVVVAVVDEVVADVDLP
jgi:steroid 5-alpha reductase family enzyme